MKKFIEMQSFVVKKKNMPKILILIRPLQSVCWPNWAVGLSELSCNLITGIIAECFSPLSKQLVFSHKEKDL